MVSTGLSRGQFLSALANIASLASGLPVTKTLQVPLFFFWPEAAVKSMFNLAFTALLQAGCVIHFYQKSALLTSRETAAAFVETALRLLTAAHASDSNSAADAEDSAGTH